MFAFLNPQSKQFGGCSLRNGQSQAETNNGQKRSDCHLIYTLSTIQITSDVSSNAYFVFTVVGVLVAQARPRKEATVGTSSTTVTATDRLKAFSSMRRHVTTGGDGHQQMSPLSNKRRVADGVRRPLPVSRSTNDVPNSMNQIHEEQFPSNNNDNDANTQQPAV